MNQALIKQVAEEYRAAKHEPNHPSYEAFISETLKQFSDLYHTWEFSLVDTTPYADSPAMFRDMAQKRLRVFTGGKLKRDNPMRLISPYLGIHNGVVRLMTINEVFRAVHDILGHGVGRVSFETFDGELAAYYVHRESYSEAAQLALYGETMGQLCHHFAGYGFVSPQGNKIIPVRF